MSAAMLPLAFVSVCLASAQTKKQAQQFVTMVYAHEAVATASPFDYTQVLTPSLAQLLGNAKLPVEPICDCNGAAGLSATIGVTTVLEKNKATVAVDLRFPNGSRHHVLLDLVWAGSWLIDDTHSTDLDSLRNFLLPP